MGEAKAAPDGRQKEASRRKKRLYVPKTHVWVTLSTGALRTAARQLLEMAVAYEASQGNANFTDAGFVAIASQLKSVQRLEAVINQLQLHDKERKRVVKAMRVERWLDEVCSWLRKPQSAALKPNDAVNRTYLRNRITSGFAFWELGSPPQDLLDDLLDLASVPSDSHRAPRMLRNAKAEGTLRKRVAGLFRRHGVIELSPDTLYNMSAAARSKGRRGASFQTREQADATFENNPTNPSELVLYVLLLLSGGERTPMVEEPMEALRRVVLRNRSSPANP